MNVPAGRSDAARTDCKARVKGKDSLVRVCRGSAGDVCGNWSEIEGRDYWISSIGGLAKPFADADVVGIARGHLNELGAGLPVVTAGLGHATGGVPDEHGREGGLVHNPKHAISGRGVLNRTARPKTSGVVLHEMSASSPAEKID